MSPRGNGDTPGAGILEIESLISCAISVRSELCLLSRVADAAVTEGLWHSSMMGFVEAFSCRQDKSNHTSVRPGAQQLAERQAPSPQPPTAQAEQCCLRAAPPSPFLPLRCCFIWVTTARCWGGWKDWWAKTPGAAQTSPQELHRVQSQCRTQSAQTPGVSYLRVLHTHQQSTPPVPVSLGHRTLSSESLPCTSSTAFLWTCSSPPVPSLE